MILPNFSKSFGCLSFQAVIFDFRLILESNEKRKEEIKDENTRVEVEKNKKRTKALEKEIMEKCRENL